MTPARQPLQAPALVLSCLAPWIPVSVFWLWRQDAWSTILAYHALIVLLSGRRIPETFRGWDRRFLPLLIPCALAGPVTFLLLPLASRTQLPAWLAEHGLVGLRLVFMIPYYGIVHPFLEQAHWGALRRHPAASRFAHPAFAGYHVLVLASLMKPGWVAVCACILMAASIAWRKLDGRTGGLLLPVAMQALADLGMISAVFLAAS